MKPIAMILLLSCFWQGWSQQNSEDTERLYFHVNISNAQTLIITEKKDNTIAVLSMASDRETQIYASHKIFRFKKAYPNTKRDLLKTVYTISTDNPELLGSLQYNFPDKYTRVGQFFTTENAY
ncbi:MAG: hypothetical protein P8Q43_03510, partial [Ulvibacter sp.]|nr:hypothetical protein [Ulvibacter sp.]